jgi:hypothetical protein
MSKLLIVSTDGVSYYSSEKKRFVTVPATSAFYTQVHNYLMSADTIEDAEVLRIRTAQRIGNIPAKLRKHLNSMDGNYYFKDVRIPAEVLNAVYAVKGGKPRKDAAERCAKFFERCAANPSTRSVEQLFDWVTRHNLRITDDGCFIAYKSVRSDYRDAFSGTFCNKPGSEVTMDRSAVNADPTIGCSTGLHVADYEYANNYSDILLTVLVDPADVVSVPTDCGFQKIRVCRYIVLSEYANNDGTEQTVELDVKEAKNSPVASKYNKWNDEVNETLLKLCKDYSNDKGRIDWESISKLMARSAESCSRQYRRIRKVK